MEILELSEESAADYPEYIDADMAENLEREFYHGFLVMEEEGEEPAAGIIWQYHGLEDEGPVSSTIEWIRIFKPEAASPLFEEYKKRIADSHVTRSTVVIQVKDRKLEKEELKKAGFNVRLTEGDNIIVKLSDLSALPVMNSRNVPDNIGTLGELTPKHVRNGIAKCVEAGKKGLCEDLQYLPMTWFEVDVSVYAEKDGEINGFLLFHKLPSGMISIQLMIGLDKDYKQNLVGMIRRFVINMENKYPPETKILLNRHNQASLQLTEKMLPRGFGIPVYAGGREEV